MYKLCNLLGENLWLVHRDKGARMEKKLQGRIRKSLLETAGKAGREEGIIASPHKQHRMVEAGEGASSFQSVAIGDSPQEARYFAADFRKMEQGMEEGVEFRLAWATMRKGRNKQALGGTGAEHPCQEIDKLDAEDTCSIMEGTDQRREKLFKGIAIGEDETGDPF